MAVAVFNIVFIFIRAKVIVQVFSRISNILINSFFIPKFNILFKIEKLRRNLALWILNEASTLIFNPRNFICILKIHDLLLFFIDSTDINVWIVRIGNSL